MRDWRDELYDFDYLGDPPDPATDPVASAVWTLSQGPTSQHRAQAVRALGACKARYDLVECSARSKSTAIRAAAAETLGWFCQTPTVLLVGLLDDPQPSVRGRAAASVSRLGRYEALKDLHRRAFDVDEVPWVRLRCLAALARMYPGKGPVGHLLQLASQLGQDPCFTAPAVRAVAELGPPAADTVCALIAARLDDQAPLGEREAASAVEALCRVGSHRVGDDLLVRALVEFPAGRRRAIAEIVNRGLTHAAPALEKVARDPNRSSRTAQAARAALDAFLVPAA
jgi:HEAT repeat protein